VQRRGRDVARTTFRYTDEQWAKIERELPAGAAAGLVRRNLEELFAPQGTAPDLAQTRKRTAHDLQIMAEAARTLRARVFRVRKLWGWTADFRLFENFPDVVWDRWVESLDTIAGHADVWRGELTRRGPLGYPYRDRVIVKMMRVWCWAGGKLSASGAGGRARDGGPLIRFLLAASKPANISPPLTISSARETIRKHKGTVLKMLRPGYEMMLRSGYEMPPGLYRLSELPESFDEGGGWWE
jgi:hypothetical protein